MKNYLLKMSAIAAVVALTGGKASAQADAGKFLASGVSDGNVLINAYMSPMMKGFGQGMNDGWFNTAKPLGTGGFDIKFNLGFNFVPTEDQVYNIGTVGLNKDQTKPYLRMAPGGSMEQSSLYGPERKAPETNAEIVIPVSYNTPFGVKDTFVANKLELPTGTGFAYTPSLPMAQLSVGIYKKTELSLRFFPQTQVGDMKAGIFGLGVKHDIKQWIAPIKDQKWDWSFVAGFTSLNAEFAFKDPLLAVDSNAFNPDPGVKYDNQKITFTGTAFMIGTMVSKQLGPGALNITPYVGVNYAYSKVNLVMQGDYPIAGPNLSHNGNKNDPDPEKAKETRILKVTDPVNIEGKLSNFRANVGMRLKLALITISAEYSLGTYNSATVSFALNLQSMVPFKM